MVGKLTLAGKVSNGLVLLSFQSNWWYFLLFWFGFFSLSFLLSFDFSSIRFQFTQSLCFFSSSRVALTSLFFACLTQNLITFNWNWTNDRLIQLFSGYKLSILGSLSLLLPLLQSIYIVRHQIINSSITWFSGPFDSTPHFTYGFRLIFHLQFHNSTRPIRSIHIYCCSSPRRYLSITKWQWRWFDEIEFSIYSFFPQS